MLRVRVDKEGFVFIDVEGTQLGIVQRLSISANAKDPFTRVEIDQIIYNEETAKRAEKIKALNLPWLKYTVTDLREAVTEEKP